MSEVETIMSFLERFGIGAIAVYMMFRLENRIVELTLKIEELCHAVSISS